MIKKKDVQKAAKQVAKVVVKKSGEAYDALEKAAAPKLKAFKKAAAPKVKQAKKVIGKQVARGVKGAKSMTKDALNSTARSLKKAAKKI